MEDDTDDDDLAAVSARPLSWLDFITFPLWCVYKMAHVTAEMADGAIDALSMHGLWITERKAMAECGALEIETMIGGGEGG